MQLPIYETYASRSRKIKSIIVIGTSGTHQQDNTCILNKSISDIKTVYPAGEAVFNGTGASTANSTTNATTKIQVANHTRVAQLGTTVDVIN